MKNFRLSSIVALTLLVAGCVSEPGLQPAPPAPKLNPSPSVTAGIGRYMEQRAHVESVAFRLRRAAAMTCASQDKTKPDLGLVVWSLANFSNGQDRAALHDEFGLTEAVTVAIAAQGAPAQAAGVEAGDIITHINDQLLPIGQGATERFISLSNAAIRKGPVRLRLNTGNTITLSPEIVCEYPALLVRSSDINAAADGRVIAITTQFYDLTKSEDELALILGHELAHNILGHLKTSETRQRKLGGLLDAFLKSSISAALASSATPPFSVEKEMDADYAGLYFIARAGFGISAAETFWSRLNKSISTGMVKSHPSGTERLKALKKAIAEIKAKQKSAAPLEPNLKRHQ
jgi:beta-barrel assembly-enhancing protease